MYREELRVVQYTITKKVEKKKSKKKETKKFKKLGLFHLWGREEDKKGKEVFFALVEDLEKGDIIEVAAKSIRFLSDDEIVAITDEEGNVSEELETEVEETEETSEEKED
ncbi:hypothetical protein [Moheibacter sediminis]|uniref:Uncharacterized protein n=1 Tax=Moheibacter sediminis TaxID=1434700 RepID=A0A1W2CGC1_9FLAO|nr:hypothetical protein [Moheibacter sediminis]SMC84004.1 hypothetical protein SAMN06296427_11028 [Moheibacter sediminis]